MLTAAPENVPALRLAIRDVLRRDGYDIRALEQNDATGADTRLTVRVAAPGRDEAEADRKVEAVTDAAHIKTRSWSVERILPDY